MESTQAKCGGGSLCGRHDEGHAAGSGLTKDGLNQSVDASGLDAVMALEDRNQMLALRDDNFREGMTAFLKKCDPVYK